MDKSARYADILALPRYGLLAPSSRVRFYEYVPHIQNAEITVHVQPFLSDRYVESLYARQTRSSFEIMRAFTSRLRSLALSHSPVLWVEKEIFPYLPAAAERLFSRNRRIVLDFDDAVFLRYSGRFQPLSRKFAPMVRRASVVTCGSDGLVDWAQQMGAPKVIKLPSAVDTERLWPSEQRRSGPTVIGWIGSPETLRFLVALGPALQALAKNVDFELRVIGANLTISGVKTSCVQWSLANERESLAAIDIGIMPLEDSPWCRSKCAYKLVQYAAMGIPSVASAIGENKNVVEHGLTGLLAYDQSEWTDFLFALCREPQLRHTMGIAARKRAESYFSHNVVAPIVRSILRELI